MKEFEFEGNWRKFVVGDEILNEQRAQRSLPVAKQLEKDLDVLVTPANYNPNDDKVIVYPNRKPGEENRVGRTSQRITLQMFGDAQLRLISIFGYERGLDLIGEPYSRTSMAGFGSWMPESSNRPEVDYDDLKVYIIQLVRGLEGEAKAQADFYKDNKGYYKQDGRIGVGLSSQPRQR